MPAPILFGGIIVENLFFSVNGIIASFAASMTRRRLRLLPAANRINNRVVKLKVVKLSHLKNSVSPL
jgi:hypothetical protein